MSEEEKKGRNRRNSEEEPQEETSLGKEILSWLQIILSGGAMVIGSRLSYIKDDPERGDIVIFRYPDNEKVYYVKRVIGLPGETVEVKDGKVYINGSDTPLDEPYLPEPMEGSYGPYEVPEGCYFMMGDNRNNSLDARFWDNKFVAKNKIVAKVLFCYYPFNRIGKVN